MKLARTLMLAALMALALWGCEGGAGGDGGLSPAPGVEYAPLD